MQSPLPVVSTKYFSFGPNERLSVQDFLRDLTRSSHATKANLRRPDQEIVTHQREPLTLPLILRSATIPDQLQSSPTNISNHRPCPVRQPSASNESSTRKQDVLRPDSHLDCGVINTKSPRIVHTYSKKLKCIPPELPTSEIVPPHSPPNTRLSDQQQDASLRRDSGVPPRDQGKPGTHPDGNIPLPSPRAANAANLESLKRKSKRKARGKTHNAEEERPVRGKKRRRRAPVEGLVLIHRISDRGAYPSEPEVSSNSASPAFSRKVILRIIFQRCLLPL